MPEQLGGWGAVLDVEIERARAAAEEDRTVILVEGRSDQLAIQALARRRGRNLQREGVVAIPIAGATNLPRFLQVLGPAASTVTGLCDEAEEEAFRRGIEAAGFLVEPGRWGLERLGFFVCVADLEDELIRALGSDAMVALLTAQGHLRRFRSFQNQPAQRHKTLDAQLWRWLGNHKIRYAPLMVDALDLDRVPRPLDLVLARAGGQIP